MTKERVQDSDCQHFIALDGKGGYCCGKCLMPMKPYVVISSTPPPSEPKETA